MLEQQVDTIVLGCTHYPFALDTIRQIAGPDVEVIDPSPAVARQTVRVMEQHGLLTGNGESAPVSIYTSSSKELLSKTLARILPETFALHEVKWMEQNLVEVEGVDYAAA
jgi:glutamate racemase